MNIYGKTLEELQSFVLEQGYPKYTAEQLANWMYKKHVTSFEHMTSLSKKVRQELSENHAVGRQEPFKRTVSQDGTIKYLFHYEDKGYIEAVYIPEETRNTLCISSQAGCKYNCEFCMTGKQGFQANLSAGEILNQLTSLPERDNISNIVFMGMGEPLDNPDNVFNSLKLLTSEYGLNMSTKRITVSTIGVLSGLKRFLDESECHLALSMHSPFDDIREEIMPAQKTNPLQDVLKIIRSHDFVYKRHFSVEYIMFKGINDRNEDVNRITKILHGLKCKVNLIRFHEIPNSRLKGTPDNEMEEFKNKLRKKGIAATVRKSRGQDIEAACGMLSTKELNK